MLGIPKSLLYVLILVLRSHDIPAACYNYHDPETNYQQEFLRPFPAPTVYQIVPRTWFVHVSAACDLVTAKLMNSDEYFFYSSFLPADAVSIENLLLVLAERGYKELANTLLAHLSVFYAPLLTSSNGYVLSYLYPAYRKDYESAHRPSLSITWFFHLNIFPQYGRYFYDVFYALMVYLFSMVPEDQRIEIILLFKPSNYKSYLPHLINSPLLHFYVLLLVLETYIQYLFRTSGVANPNFLNWSYLVFTSLFILERRWKMLKGQKLIDKAVWARSASHVACPS